VLLATAAGSFQIDATEVTRGQYGAWVKTNPSLPGSSDPACSWKTTYAQDSTCITAAGADYYTGADEEHHPVVCVDWCDAYFYCLGIGKRLCGKIGGGSAPFDQSADASVSQWYAVCSGEGANHYPYGRDYQPEYCNGTDYTGAVPGAHTTLPVGSLSTCQAAAGSGYPGVYDLSGNAAEWVDSCDDGSAGAAATPCHRHGGSYRAGPTGAGILGCLDASSTYARNEATEGLGFRCCSRP
jgi:formylglycine-generating enzyme required for sulfatase activity